MEAPAPSVVEQLYRKLKAMAAGYELKPGERVNEVELSRRLGVSRTPLREALNRLATEGFLSFVAGKGFFCRALDPHEVYHLYQLRKVVETAAVRLAQARVTEQDIGRLLRFLEETGPEAGARTTEELVALDERFHEQLVALSGNPEMLRVIRNVNERIRFVRWIDMDRRSRPRTQAEHRRLVVCLGEGRTRQCAAILEKHIDRRLDQIVASIKEGYAQIYLQHDAGG